MSRDESRGGYIRAPLADPDAETDEGDHVDGHLGIFGDLPIVHTSPVMSRRGSMEGRKVAMEGFGRPASPPGGVSEDVGDARAVMVQQHSGSYNMFAKRRHYAQTFLDIALLVNNVSHLVSVYVSEDSHLKTTLLGLIVASIILQVAAAFMLFHITCLYQLMENKELHDMAERLESREEPLALTQERISYRHGHQGNNLDQTRSCCPKPPKCDIKSYETTVLVLDGIATGIILIVTIINVFISAFFQLHTNVRTEYNRKKHGEIEAVVKGAISGGRTLENITYN